MTKKSKIELNRVTDLTEIDSELDDALAKLEATTSKVDEILASEAGTKPAGTVQTQFDDTAGGDEAEASEEE